MKNRRKKWLIIIAATLLVGTSAVLTTQVVKSKQDSATKVTKTVSDEQKAAQKFFIPATSNGDVDELNYDSSKITKTNDIYKESTQTEILAQLTAKKAEADYSVTNTLLLSNPFLTNTNSVYAYFKSDTAVTKLEYTVHVADDDIADFTATAKNNSATAGEYEYLLIGLIAGEKNTVTMTATLADGTTQEKTFSFTPTKLTSGSANKLNVESGESTQKMSNGLFALIGDRSTGSVQITMVDNDGYIRNEIPTVSYNQLRLVFDDEGYMYFSISGARIVKMSGLGQIVATYNMYDYDYEIHHDFALDSNGDIIALATSLTAKKETKYVEDRIVKISTDTGKVTELVDFEDLLPDLYDKATGIDTLTNNKGYHDPIHANAIQLIDDDTILISSRETSSILKISSLNETPKVEYTIGDESVWEDIDLDADVLEKVGDFTAQAGQHSITYVPTDEAGVYEVYMFNNNSGLMESRTDFEFTNYDGIGGYAPTDSDNSYYYRYRVDENKGTFTLIDKIKVPYSPFISSVQELDGNVVVDSGQKAVFSEYDEDGDVIKTFSVNGATKFIYRVFKYDFAGFYFAE